jgi:photosystem II stability/assembly factor-like uncharacterized protein
MICCKLSAVDTTIFVHFKEIGTTMETYGRFSLAGGMLLAGMLFLAACAAVSPFPTFEAPGSNPTPVQVPLSLTVTATFTPTLQPSTTPTPSISVGPPSIVPAGQLLKLTSIHMMTPAKGWATGSAMAGIVSSVSLPAIGDVFHTDDGGTDWHLISPNGVAPDSVNAVYFLDASNAWIVVSTAFSPTVGITSTAGISSTALMAYRTEDGGQTWQGGEPFAVSGKGPGILDFVDTQYGWLMMSLGVAAGSEGVEILKTDDSGAHWKQVSLTSGLPGPSTANNLPLGCDKNGMAFVNASTGWVTGTCPGGAIFLYMSQDGGQTWQPQVPPPPPGDPADLFSDCQCAVDPPLFVSAQNGVMVITIFQANQGSYLYTTDDGGKTWMPRDLPVTQLFGGPDFFDANDGMISDGQRFFVTNDGGQTWAQLGTLPAPGQNLIGGLDFVDENNGWVTDGQHLYVTHNGSQTWITIIPVVAAASPNQPASLDVTLADDGQTLTLQVGQRLVLDLDRAYTWTVTVENPTVVGPLVDVPVPEGSQGVYEAFKSGETTLTANGDPICRQAQPPCTLASRRFRLQLVVP